MGASEGSGFLPTSGSVWVTARGWDAAFSKVPESSESLSQAWGKAGATQDGAGCECHTAGAPCHFPLCTNTPCHSRTGTQRPTGDRHSDTHTLTDAVCSDALMSVLPVTHTAGGLTHMDSHPVQAGRVTCTLTPLLGAHPGVHVTRLTGRCTD